MWCPECDEDFDREEVIENNYKCPECGYDFREEVDGEDADDFDDLMMIDFVEDGELEGDF